jgi:hypothetical protein
MSSLTRGPVTGIGTAKVLWHRCDTRYTTTCLTEVTA